jgi:large subunit ribosomal protein L13
VSFYRLKHGRQHQPENRFKEQEEIASFTLTVTASIRTIGVCGCWSRRVQIGGSPVGPTREGSPFMRTLVASAKSADSRWHVIDAQDQVLGRVATLAARLLQGKHKAVYTPFIDTGDHVVVVNAARVKLTGRKDEQKVYRRHSGYEGGLREERASVVRQRQPIRLVEEAIRGMLPKTKMGDAMYRKLKVYAGPDHPHAAQQPRKIEVA